MFLKQRHYPIFKKWQSFDQTRKKLYQQVLDDQDHESILEMLQNDFAQNDNLQDYYIVNPWTFQLANNNDAFSLNIDEIIDE